MSREMKRAANLMWSQRSFLDEGGVSRSVIMHEMLLERIRQMTNKLKNNLHKYA